MRITILFGILTLLVAAQTTLNPKAKSVPPQNTIYIPKCEDYRMWYEQARQREYDTFKDPGYRFSDLSVTTWPERRRLRADELMALLEKHRRELGIDDISLSKGTPRPLDISELSYPQYYEKYTLSKEDWAELQRRAKENLAQGLAAHEDVIAHWKSIAAGNPPFGLKVR